MKIADKAYLAGLIDGEGYMGLVKRGNGYRVRIIVSNCNLPLLEHVKSLIGGYITKKSKAKPYWTQGYNLTINGIDKWLPQILPYLVGKHKKAQLMLEAKTLLKGRKDITSKSGNLSLDRLSEIDCSLRQKEWLI